MSKQASVPKHAASAFLAAITSILLFASLAAMPAFAEGDDPDAQIATAVEQPAAGEEIPETQLEGEAAGSEAAEVESSDPDSPAESTDEDPDTASEDSADESNDPDDSIVSGADNDEAITVDESVQPERTAKAKAQATEKASGESGTCTWVIDSDGCLTIRPASGSTGSLGDWTWETYKKQIKSVKFEGTIHASGSLAQLFYYYSNLETVDLSGLDTSNVTDVSGMFLSCGKLQSVDMSGLDLSSVTNMRSLFCNCSSLTQVNMNGVNTASVTNMANMFSGCRLLASLDLTGIDTSNVTDMSYMFDSCEALTSLDLSGFNTSNVTTMHYMFDGCEAIPSLDVSSFDTRNVTDMVAMFAGCTALNSVDVSRFNTAKVTDMFDLFAGCSSLTSLNVSGFDTSNVVGMGQMFEGCSSLTSLDVSNFDTSNTVGMGGMFSGCSSLTTLDLSNFNTSKVTGMANMFSECTSLESVNLSSFKTPALKGMYCMFFNCSSLTSLDLSGFDTTKVTSIVNTFSGCSSLSSVKLGSTFSFVGNGSVSCALPDAPSDSPYTGKWTNGKKSASAADLAALSGSDIVGTWTWEKPAQSLSGAAIGGLSAKTFTGKAIAQYPTVKLSGKTLKRGTDYDVAFKNNVNAGTATVTVTGKGNYAGSKSATFKIKKAKLTSVKLAKAAVAYTGKAQKPAVSSVKAGKLKVPKGSRTVSYKANKAVGVATVAVTGKGNYTGTAKATFKIVPPKAKLTSVAGFVPVVNGKKIAKGGILAKWAKAAGSPGWYEVQVSTSKTFKGGWTATKTFTAAMLKKYGTSFEGFVPKKKVRYYVRVRAVKKVSGVTLRGAWSDARSAVSK